MQRKRTHPATPQEIWEILREISRYHGETERIMKEHTQEAKRRAQEIDRRFKEQAQEADRRAKETDRRAKEADRRAKEADRRAKEADIRGDQFDRRLKKLDLLFNGHWGKLMESLVKGDLVGLLAGRGIGVTGLAKEHERKLDGEDYEIDIIAVNGEDVVAVEVKTTLEKSDVDHFLAKLGDFKRVFHEYADRRLLGAVAYLKENSSSARYSEKKGLFVIRATGSSASILNREGFVPRTF